MVLSERVAALGVWLPLLFVAAANLAWLDAHVVPVHDTFYNFANFQIFYSHFFLSRELVQWYPYGAFGLPADYQQLISFSPMNYLFGAIGALLRVRDALLLFKLSVIAEQLVFVLGTWLLSRRLFASRATAIALGLAAGGTVVWYAQQWFELRFFYLLPLLLFFLHGFFEARRPELLWLAGLTAVAWALGNVPYFAPIWVLVLAIVCSAPALRYGRAWKDLFALRASNWLLFGAWLAAAGTCGYFALHSLDFLSIPDQERDPLTGLVDIETFRTFGGNADLGVLARSVLTAWPQQLPWGSGADNAFYFGLLPLFGVGVALAARERSASFLGLVAAAVVLVLLSLGGIVATIAFYLPGMALYRHVGLVYGLVKTLLIIAAGFGLERVWRWRLPLVSPSAGWIAAAASGIVMVAAIGVAAGAAEEIWAAAWPEQLFVRICLYAGLAVAGVFFTRSLKVGLLLALALDLAIFQAALFELRAPKLAPLYAKKLGAYDVAPVPYQAQRTQEASPTAPEGPRPAAVLDLAKHPESMEVYYVTYELAGFDPCRALFWSELSTDRVSVLNQVEKLRTKDFDLITGCREPKLRVVSGPFVSRIHAEIRAAFVAAARSAAPVRDVIFVAAGVSPPPAASAASPDAGEVTVTRFTPNELTATVAIPGSPGAWLLYADAFHPGWHASIDDRPVSIAEANLAFKAVWVPTGAHEVRFWFARGLSYRASYAVALIGLASALGFVALAPLGARQPPPRSPPVPPGQRPG